MPVTHGICEDCRRLNFATAKSKKSAPQFIKETVMLRIRTILHPTDFSASADNAWQVACSLADAYGAELLLLHVQARTLSPMGEYGMLPPETENQEELEQRLAAIAPTLPSLRVARFVVEGKGAAEIMAFAKEHQCDLIVMGTHGRKGLARLFMGSVAEEVVRKAPCAVLTLKQPIAVIETGFTTAAVEVAG